MTEVIKPDLADLFLHYCKVEKRVLPGLVLTEAEKKADLDLYRLLQRIDRLGETSAQ